MEEVMIWPIYLDADKSLNEGRKISKEYAISEPRIKEIEKAAQKLKYKYTVEEDKSYPGEWYNKSGRILIETEDSKKEILMNLSTSIKEIREARKNYKPAKKGKKGKNN